MELTFRYATAQDVETLVAIRKGVMLGIYDLPPGTEPALIERSLRDYYTTALDRGEHAAVLVFDGETPVGSGGASFYRMLPTTTSLNGQHAFVMAMFTHEDYRRRGIASRVLSMLIQACHERGVYSIKLDATDMGRPLYERYGFEPLPNYMQLPSSHACAKRED